MLETEETRDILTDEERRFKKSTASLLNKTRNKQKAASTAAIQIL